MTASATSGQSSSGSTSHLDQIRMAGLWLEGKPLRLHLGCGETHFDDYLNIDYPPAEHSVMKPVADIFADIKDLDFPKGSVDEIRLHHVFEHFSRVTALAMLIKWHEWLKVGGVLRITTPDIMGCARNITSNTSWRVKMGNIRHLAGDQGASWAYHVDHWFEERFKHTLGKFGFDPVQTSTSCWDKEPLLWNVDAIGTKKTNMDRASLLNVADELLWESTVADEERPVWEIWCRQLRDVLSGGPATAPANTTPFS